MNKLVNLINIGLVHKKKIIKTKIESNDINILKILIKLNLITFVKKIDRCLYIIKINNNFSLKLKNFFKKKKITIKSGNNNTILIISNNYGVSVWDGKIGGILLWKLSF